MSKTTSSLGLNLVRLDRRKSTPLTAQLYNSLRRAIESGMLSKGFRLPSTRDFAVQLSVSRTTVVNAFEQLMAEGYLTGEVGRGTHVSDRLPEESLMARFYQTEQPAKAKEVKQARRSPTPLSTLGKSLAIIDPTKLFGSNELKPFRASVPALDAFPVSRWSQIVRKTWRDIDVNSLSYGDAEGYLPLRCAIANYVRGFRGVRCTEDQVMIVSGTQQAFDVITRLVVEPGDKVLMESPGYPRAKQAFQSAGAKLVHVPVDQQGLCVDWAREHAMDARLAYVTPSHQFPLGVTMTIERRMQLIELASQHEIWIVEDDYDSEFRYAHRPIPALQGLDSGDRTIYVGSFSKIIYPSLGVGFAIVPPSLIDGFKKTLYLAGRPPSLVDQIVLTQFIEEGHFARHLRRMRTVHEARRSALVSGLQKHLGDVLKIVGADAGLHCTAILNANWSDVIVADEAAAQGVLLRPLSSCMGSDQQSDFCNGLVFGFACSTPIQIRDAIRKIVPLFKH
ncbi:MAG: PLP-dependent aminotransferase family protein [Pirellulaceae bacterium]